MTQSQAEGFYAVHKERPFFGELTEFMSSGPCMVLALQKENAVEEWRKTIPATNPEEAEDGTISKDFETNIGDKNALQDKLDKDYRLKAKNEVDTATPIRVSIRSKPGAIA